MSAVDKDEGAMSAERRATALAMNERFLSAVRRLVHRHTEEWHRGVAGSCECPRCGFCGVLLPEDGVCVVCSGLPFQVWGLVGSQPGRIRTSPIANRLFYEKYPDRAPEGYFDAPADDAELDPFGDEDMDDDTDDTHTREALVPTKLTAEPSKRGYRSVPVNTMDITDQLVMDTIDGLRGYREFSKGRKTLLLILEEPGDSVALGVPISQEAAFSIIHFVAATHRRPCPVGHLGDGYAVLQLPH